MTALILERRAPKGTSPAPLPTHRYDPARQLNVTPDGRPLITVIDAYGYTSTQVGDYLRTDD